MQTKIQDGRQSGTSGQRPLATVFVYIRGSIATVPEVVFLTRHPGCIHTGKT